jgi:hypothetical protein
MAELREPSVMALRAPPRGLLPGIAKTIIQNSIGNLILFWRLRGLPEPWVPENRPRRTRRKPEMNLSKRDCLSITSGPTRVSGEKSGK